MGERARQWNHGSGEVWDMFATQNGVALVKDEPCRIEEFRLDDEVWRSSPVTSDLSWVVGQLRILKKGTFLGFYVTSIFIHAVVLFAWSQHGDERVRHWSTCLRSYLWPPVCHYHNHKIYVYDTWQSSPVEHESITVLSATDGTVPLKSELPKSQDNVRGLTRIQIQSDVVYVMVGALIRGFDVSTSKAKVVLQFTHSVHATSFDVMNNSLYLCDAHSVFVYNSRGELLRDWVVRPREPHTKYGELWLACCGDVLFVRDRSLLLEYV